MKLAQSLSVEELQSQNLLLIEELQKREEKITRLHQTNDALTHKNDALTHKNDALTHKNDELKGQLDWLRRQMFGKRSERYVSNLNAEQLLLEGFEHPQMEKEQKKIVPAHTRGKPNRNGQDKITLPSDLPVETTILDIPEEQKVCAESGEPLVKIGVEITHKLAHRPGSYFIKEFIRPKYAHPKQEEKGIVTAELPDSLLPRCRADESLLAEIIVKKFADHLPLYRIQESFNREGVKISRKLLSQWVMRTAMALKPLYEEMRKQILLSDNIFIDETPVKLQQPIKCKQAYMWVLVGGNVADPPYRIYNFRDNRRHENVDELLFDYRGTLHSDKYGAYEKLAKAGQITWCPCWSHIRRKFLEAEAGDPLLRQWMIRKIRYLFMLERVAWARTPDERLRIRQEKEIPIINEIIERTKKELIEGNILPKSKLREALGYLCSLIPYLKNYTQLPFARLDNNVAERAVKPVAIGRKNWIFFGSLGGGEAGAILFSLVQTCRGLDINPREYLEDVFRRIMSHDAQKLHELLPDQWLAQRQNNDSI